MEASQPRRSPSPLQPPCFQLTDLEEWSSLLHSSSRPLLTHLNADTTWLLQLPYPAAAPCPLGRTHFNILFDPWLQGPQSDVASWFSTQWHAVPAGVATIADLNALLHHIEGRGVPGKSEYESNAACQLPSYIDVVAISHEFTDHCHRATLQELPRQTPVFATDVAADLVRTWGHFDTVITTPGLGAGVDWKRLTVGSLPDWLAIGRVVTPGNFLYYHSAVFVVFDLDQGSTTSSGGEAVVYSPHGIESRDLEGIKASGFTTLALLHGMHDVALTMTQQLNLGALNGIRAVGASGARYWVATHDEVKVGRGFVASFLRRTVYTLKEAIAHEQKQLREADKLLPKYHFQELGSGEGLVLK